MGGIIQKSQLVHKSKCRTNFIDSVDFVERRLAHGRDKLSPFPHPVCAEYAETTQENFASFVLLELMVDHLLSPWYAKPCSAILLFTVATIP